MVKKSEGHVCNSDIYTLVNSCDYWFRSAKRGEREMSGGKEPLKEGVTTSLEYFISQSTPIIGSSGKREGKEER